MGNLFDFGEALRIIKNGGRVKRLGWNDKEQFIDLATEISFRSANGELFDVDHKDMGNKAIAFHGTRGIQLGWLASQPDMLAEDWVEA